MKKYLCDFGGAEPDSRKRCLGLLFQFQFQFQFHFLFSTFLIFLSSLNLKTDSSRTRINTGFCNKNAIDFELKGSDSNGVFNKVEFRDIDNVHFVNTVINKSSSIPLKAIFENSSPYLLFASFNNSFITMSCRSCGTST